MKLLVLQVLILASLSSFAAVSKSELANSLAGKYHLTVEQNEVAFEIDSKSNIKIVSEGREIGSASLKIQNSSDSALMSGLPVAHLIFAYAGDEDTWNYHLFLALVQEDDSSKLVMITAFATFNEGPNNQSQILRHPKVSLKKLISSGQFKSISR
jgi:hypothetical protein